MGKKKALRYLTAREANLYGLAGGGQIFGYTLIVNYLSYFYINVLLVDPKIVAVLLLAEGIWDAVNNPLAGLFLDRRKGMEKAPPVLRGGALPLGVLTALLFAAPYLLDSFSPGSPVRLCYMIGTWLCWELLYTVTDVAFWSLSASASPDGDDRAFLAKRVNLFQSVCGTLPTLLVPLLLDGSNAGFLSLRALFLLLGLTSAVGVGLLALAGFFVKERVHQTEKRVSVRSMLLECVRNPLLRALLLSSLFSSLQDIGSGMTTYYFADVLGSASLSIVVGSASVITWLFSYRLTDFLRKKWSGRQLLKNLSLLFGLMWLLVFLAGFPFYESRGFMTVLLFLLHGAFGLFSTPYSVVFNEQLAEATDYTEWTQGVRNEGLSFSAKMATQKCGSALSQALVSLLLSFLGYQSPVENRRQAQTGFAKRGIFCAYALTPAAGFLLSVLPLCFGNLSAEARGTMQKELAERRGNAIE